MTDFFTSDTHFFHHNIIKYCRRPFPDVEKMSYELVKRWNSVVGYNDTVYHLGDFMWGTREEGKRIRAHLNGSICLIRGNHDPYDDLGFQWVKDFYEYSNHKQKIVLFHYGMRTWRHDLRGAWHLYGHSHSMLPPFGKSFDIGVDSWDYTPLSYEQVKKEMDKRDIGKHPMFAEFKAELGDQRAQEEPI